MDAEAEFLDLLTRARAGDQAAATQLVALYAKPLRLVIRRRLTPTIRTLYDSIDFVQLVWADFFSDRCAGENFNDPKALLAFLSRIGVNKVLEAHRRKLEAQKRTRTRQVALPDDLPQRGPSVEQVAETKDTLDHLARNAPPKIQQILDILRAGGSHAEVAVVLGITEPMLKQILENLRRFPIRKA